MKRVRIATAVAVALVPVLTALPANAAPATAVVCQFTMSVHFSPGLTMTPGSGTKGTGGEVGTVACQGTLDGAQVTGTGTFGFQGRYTNASCMSGSGAGTYSMTVPTSAGTRHVEGTYTQNWIGLLFLVEGSQPGAHFKATAVGAPTQGNCVTTPLTDGIVTMTAFTD